MTDTLRRLRLHTPPRFRGLTLESPSVKALQVDPEGPFQRWLLALREGRIVRAEGLLESCGLGLWAVGSQASALLSAILADSADTLGYNGLYLPVTDYLESMRPDGDRRFSDRVEADEVLVLANLGSENQTDWTQATVRSLLFKRYEEGLPTLVSAFDRPEAQLPPSFAHDAFLTVAIMK